MIVDIISSSMFSNEERSKIQENIKNLLLKINNDFEEAIFSKFMITLGDEFEGALIDSSKAYDIFLYIERELKVPIRCGIGIGPISDVENREKALQLSVVEFDGVAFHRARKAINDAKTNDVILFVNTDNNKSDNIFNIISKLVQIIKSKWTNTQREYVSQIRTMKTKAPIKDVAEHYGVTKQAISKSLKTAHLDSILEAESYLRSLLSQPISVDFQYSTSGG